MVNHITFVAIETEQFSDENSDTVISMERNKTKN